MRGKLYDKYFNLQKRIKEINPLKVILTLQLTENDILTDEDINFLMLDLKYLIFILTYNIKLLEFKKKNIVA